KAPEVGRADTATFFSLGVFSGIASSCCAPVLAGVMTLSAMSGSPIGGLVLGLAYVFGMVLPLFGMALLWDKLPKGGQSRLRAKPLRLRLAGRTLHTNTVNLAVAIGFTIMGVLVILQANTTTMTGGDSPLLPVADWLTDVFKALLGWTAPIPEPILGLGLLAVVAVFVIATLRDRRRPKTTPAETVTSTQSDNAH
ncbi:MAG: cytochrome c biogenesis protein CcdA, partial [Propionibacteriaceae bacterium]|nr:cytochrome c biogenesis protein CcdA [Propionibacteriaceae bacterium]